MKILTILCAGILLVSCGQSVPYKQAQQQFKQPEDVGKWLDRNFYFDKARQSKISKRLKQQGAYGLLVKSDETLYNSSSGYCVDSANFAMQNINKLDPKYNARWVFVENALGRPNHWVTAFDKADGLYIMDYGTGGKWSVMQGTHGPYQSLDGYKKFLQSLHLPNFSVGDVYFREMPGEEG
jgi:hypothetical protein